MLLTGDVISEIPDLRISFNFGGVHRPATVENTTYKTYVKLDQVQKKEVTVSPQSVNHDLVFFKPIE